MSFNKTAPKGMRDILPLELAVREKVLGIIKQTYTQFGFMQIETPCVEDINLLTSKQGGDNEKLIFKILKRGDKLENADDNSLCDLGLRYDLTVPLTRYYANNIGQLPTVFKAMQIGNVWRAERPQKGRYRQFTQCDIDIIGEESNIAEIELINATAHALIKLGLNDFTVKVNDRRLLKAVSRYCGYAEADSDKVFITMDKLDKIGIDGVYAELKEFSDESSADKVVDFLNRILVAIDKLAECKLILGDFLDDAVSSSLETVITSVSQLVKCNVSFEPTLVRGMNYYTGTIFEVGVNGLNISVAGGGRYDEMIGKLLSTSVPACGFSIGFERIVSVLLETEAYTNAFDSRVAFVVDKDIAQDKLTDVFMKANEIRTNKVCQVLKKIKNFNYQVNQLKKDGYNEIYLVTNDGTRNVE